MLFDTHMHCDYSCDSHMQFADAIAAAEAEKIGMIVTEHWDYDYPTNPDAFTFDIDEYLVEKVFDVTFPPSETNPDAKTIIISKIHLLLQTGRMHQIRIQYDNAH